MSPRPEVVQSLRAMPTEALRAQERLAAAVWGQAGADPHGVALLTGLRSELLRRARKVRP
jgi:hypothetical protein